MWMLLTARIMAQPGARAKKNGAASLRRRSS
jgi:hypothetical protein